MNEEIKLHYEINGKDFTMAGKASGELKKVLKKLGLPSGIIRRASICMYEGEINMIIHANGGTADICVDTEKIVISLKDKGPGIPNVELAMQEGWSTANDNVRNLGFGAGMGLPNMKKNSDSIEINTELNVGTSVVMTLKM